MVRHLETDTLKTDPELGEVAIRVLQGRVRVENRDSTTAYSGEEAVRDSG